MRLLLPLLVVSLAVVPALALMPEPDQNQDDFGGGPTLDLECTSDCSKKVENGTPTVPDCKAGEPGCSKGLVGNSALSGGAFSVVNSMATKGMANAPAQGAGIGKKGMKKPATVAATTPDESGTATSDDKQDQAQIAAVRPQTPIDPAVKKDLEQVVGLEKAGNREAAREAALQALQEHPKDPNLLAYVKLTEPVRKSVDSKVVKARAAELEAGTRQFEGAGDAPILASPINFGAGAGAAGGALKGAQIQMPPAATLDARTAYVLRDAQSKIGVRDYKGAESALTRRLEAAPDDRPVLTLRGLLRRELGRYADSAEDAKAALRVDPRDLRALHLLARDLIDLKRPAEAKAEADRALGYFDKDAEGYAIRAEAHAALGHKEEELADLARAASLDASFDDLYNAARRRVTGEGRGSGRSWPVWLGAVGTALLFFSFALFRKRGDSSVRLALRKEDHDVVAKAAPVLSSVPKGFRVVKELGHGGMGVVYEAVDLGLQRTVALKKLRPEIAENPRERSRFLKEARLVAGLKHPNIVEIHSIHEEDGGLFLVFERVPGESLHDRLGRGALPPAEAAALLKQVAAALDYAHAQGVVHQDLKPANVMVSGGQAKVMDFGIARRVQETLSTMSKVEVAGTPAYMAPEQEQGRYGPAADVFALGAFAYEALVGQTPFPTGGIMMKIQSFYRKPSEASPTLNPAVDAVIARALAPKPEERWPSASSFVDALARSLS